jgi:acyl-CoA thioester hydrolase
MSIKPYTPEIRFSDIDTMGHVNNAVYFTYFEQARMHYFSELVGRWDWRKHGVIVAHHEIDYKRPIFLLDRVEIWVYCQAMGTKSLTMSYKVNVKTKDGDVEVCTGATVLVCFDHETQKTCSVPEEWKGPLQQITPQS